MLYLRSLIDIRMKQLVKLSLMAGLLVVAGACTQTVEHKGRKPLVKIGKNYLYQDDLQMVMPVGITGKDSVTFADEYIRNWVEDILLYKKAEGNIPDNAKINELVASYRRALVMHTFQEELVNQEVGNAITDAEVEAYYTANAEAFRAEQPYVQGLYLKVPLQANKLSTVRSLYKKNTQDAIDKLEKYGISNAVDYDYFYDRWLPVPDIALKLPVKELNSDADYLNRKRNVEVQDTAFCYFLHVENFIPKGEVLPLEYARNEIKEILINLKRVDFINKMRTDLYEQASENKEVIYYKDSNE